MLTEVLSKAADGAHKAQEHGSNGHEENIADMIMHHIQDSVLVPLDLFGFDISITKHVLMMWIVAVFLIVIFRVSFRKGELVPRGFANILEALILFVRDDIVYANLGKVGQGYVVYFLTLFFFVLTCNLLGLIPFASTATSNIAVTASLAVISFIMIQASGIMKKGLKNYIKEFIPHGLPVWLIPIMIPVEIISMFTKPFALAIRLFANMTGGHVVILALFGLITTWKASPVILFPLAITILELLIAFIQAYIFTFLTAIFMSLNMQEGH